MYDSVILGATFAAAGLLSGGGNCLVIEPGPQAGAEFLGALHFGCGYDALFKTPEAQALYEGFCEKGAVFEGRGCLFPCAPLLYSCFLNRDVLLSANIVDIGKTDGGFSVTIHTVKGFRVIHTKNIIDTRCGRDNVLKKAFHAWIRPKDGKSSVPGQFQNLTDGVQAVEPLFGDYENSFILKLEMSECCTYDDARRELGSVLTHQLPGFRLGLSADCFAFTPKKTGVFERGGVVQMPSCGFKNPLLAYDAGAMLATRGGRI